MGGETLRYTLSKTDKGDLVAKEMLCCRLLTEAFSLHHFSQHKPDAALQQQEHKTELYKEQ